MKLEIAPVPEPKELIALAEVDAKPAREMILTTVAHYADAAAMLKRVKSALTDITNQRRALTAPIDEFKKTIMDLYRPATVLLEEADAAIKKAILKFEAEQERLRKIEEDRLRELQRKEHKEKPKLK